MGFVGSAPPFNRMGLASAQSRKTAQPSVVNPVYSPLLIQLPASDRRDEMLDR
jgi:hypothetical protein